MLNDRKISRELGALLRLGWPLCAAQLLQVSMGFVDTVMVGRLGALELAAIGLGSAFWVLIFLGCVGSLMAISPIVAQHFGAGRPAMICRTFQQGIWLSLLIGVGSSVLLLCTPALMPLLRVDSEVIPLVKEYVAVVVWGMPGLCLYLVPRFLSEGIAHVRPVLIVQLILLPLNVLGNAIFIYGLFGFPAMGVSGAALSSAIGMWLGAVLIFVYVRRTSRYRSFQLFVRWSRPDLAEIATIFRLSFPIAIAMVLETSLFLVVILLMGSLGKVALAAHQVAINYAALMFMVPVGLSMALTVRVGQALGAGDRDEARFRGWLGIVVGAGFMLLSAGFIVVFTESIAGLYTDDSLVLELAVSLLLVAAVFQVFDGIQVSAAGALRGYHDTRIPMVIGLFSYWLVGLPISWYLGLYLEVGPVGLWIGLVTGLVAAAFLLSHRYHRISLRAATISGCVDEDRH